MQQIRATPAAAVLITAADTAGPSLVVASASCSNPTTTVTGSRNKTSADAILSGEPAVTLEFEIVGERDVLDVRFVGDAPVDSDAH